MASASRGRYRAETMVVWRGVVLGLPLIFGGYFGVSLWGRFVGQVCGVGSQDVFAGHVFGGGVGLFGS